jgi:3-carboxy-cis,cis-muconate cycloisomerase
MGTDSTSAYKATTRPSSSPSEFRLLDGIFARGSAAEAASERAFLQALLDVEAALARAGARVNLVPEVAAEAIAAACRAERFDIVSLADGAGRHAQPVVPIVAALRETVGDEAAEHVHRWVTSQDIVDTALMVVARRVLAPLLDDLPASPVPDGDTEGPTALVARALEAHRAR